MESLTKPELLMLFSILEGELEARDLVIDALKVTMSGADDTQSVQTTLQNLSRWYKTLTHPHPPWA